MYIRLIYEVKLGNTERYYPKEDEIVEYKYYREPAQNGYLQSYQTTKRELYELTQNGDRFFTYNKELHRKMRECKWEQTVNGEWFLRTIPNGTEIDNLLSLPKY